MKRISIVTLGCSKNKAIRVVSKSPCPVITIKGKEHFNGCRTIILPLDLEKETKPLESFLKKKNNLN